MGEEKSASGKSSKSPKGIRKIPLELINRNSINTIVVVNTPERYGRKELTTTPVAAGRAASLQNERAKQREELVKNVFLDDLNITP